MGGASSSSGGSIGSAGLPGVAGWNGAGGSGPSVCGDGRWGSFEQCDDGNTTSGDGCNATCQIEASWTCPAVGAACRQPRCGDGIQDSIFLPSENTGTGGSFGTAGSGNGSGGSSNGTWIYEACDDGNTNDGDGCSASCKLEPGWICGAPEVPCHQMRCGDGIQDEMWVPGASSGSGGSGSSGAGDGSSSGGSGPSGSWIYEQCDDGNTASNDGCTAECSLEPGYICEPGQPCRAPTCGDGYIDWIPGPASASGGASSVAGAGGVGGAVIVASGGGGNEYGHMESCDDSNTTNGDGCSSLCDVEAGYSCWTGTCKLAVCGDGMPDYPVEQCDDGNNVANDGCTNCFYDGFGGASGGASGMGGASSASGGRNQ